MEKEIIMAIALGIGLSASAGFRVFVPLLIAGLAGRFGFLPLDSGFEWMTSWPVITAFAIATIVEIAAYYIPFIDNLLDYIAMPLSIIAGTILATSILPVEAESLKWILGFIIGGGASATVQSGTTALRLASTTTTAGIGNSLFSTGENTAAVGLSFLALILPLLIAILVVVLLFFILRWLFKRKSRRTSR